MFAPKIWAIDLGCSAVKGVLVTPVRNGVAILDADIVPLAGDPPEGLKEPSRDTRLWVALAEFQRRHRLDKHKIAIAIPARNTLVREIKIALVGKRNIDEFVRFEASNAIPFVLDEVLWDYHLFEGDQDANTREGAIFAVKKTAIHTYLHALSQVGAERVMEITLAPLAALSFLQFEMGREGSALLLDVGAESTSLVAADNSRFWMRNMVSGGNKITWLLRDKFGISFEQAEEAKQNIGRSPLAAQLVDAMKPALHEMVAELKTNLGYCRRGGVSTEFDRVYAVGGGSRLMGLKAQMRQSLGQELRDIRSLDHVFVSPKVDASLVQTNLDQLAVAIGTGVKALDKAPIKVSFVPESTARLAQASSTRRFMAAAGVILWAIALTVFLFCQQYVAHLREADLDGRQADLHYRDNRASLQAAQRRETAQIELAYLQSVGRGRRQTPMILDGVERLFQQVNRMPGCRFRLLSFACVREGAELNVTIKVKVAPEPGADEGQGYKMLQNRIVDGLRNSPVMARATGMAKFGNPRSAVVAQGAGWGGLVKKDDQIMAHNDGIWRKVANVQSDAKLLLTQPFAEGEMESPYTVTRVDVVDWDPQELEYVVRGQAPVQLTPAAEAGPPE